MNGAGMRIGIRQKAKSAFNLTAFLIIALILTLIGVVFFKLVLEPSILMFRPVPGDNQLDQFYSTLAVMSLSCCGGLALMILGLGILISLIKGVLKQ